MVVRELITRLGYSLDQTQVNKAERATERIKTGASQAAVIFGRLAFAIGSALSIRSIISAGDEMQSLRARIGMLPQTVGDVGAAFDTVADHASASGTSIEAYATLYARVGNAAQDYIKTQEELITVTDTISKALTVGGTSTQEASAVMLQFSQALASGVLQGDEFRSMAEAAPQYLQKLSEELNIPRQNLKKMASEGKLAAKDVIEATKRMSDYFDVKFKGIPMTVGRAMTIVSNRFKLGIDRMNRDTDFIRIIADKIISAFDLIETGVTKVVKAFDGWDNMLRIVGVTIGTIIGIKAIQAIISFGAISWGALLPWLAIAAAIALVALAIEDVIVWIQGGNSVIGKFLGKWEEVRWIARAAIDFIGDALLILGDILGAIGAMIVGVFTLDPALFKEGLIGLTNILWDTLKIWGNNFKKSFYEFIYDPIVKAVKDAFDYVTGFVGRIWGTIKQTFNPSVNVAGMQQLQGVNPQSLLPSMGRGNNIQTTTNVSVTVPPGTPQEQAEFIKRSANASFKQASNNDLLRGLEVYAP